VADMPTGQLIRLYRMSRKKSTVYVATHAGITQRYLEMIESGAKTPSLPTLREIAKVLGVRTASLMADAPPSENHEGPVNPFLASAERSLFTYRTLTLDGGAEPPELDDLSERVNAAWSAWFLSPNKYSDVLGALPDLIIDAERLVHSSNRSRAACRLASDVYQLARPVLKHAGRADLGPLVADRIMRYAEESDDPLMIAAATWNLGQAMLTDDMSEGALDLTIMAAERLEPTLADGPPEIFSVYGALLQVAAIAATRTGDPWRARELLRGPARQAATRVGEGHNHHHTLFGPSNVGIHMVSVEFESREIAEALRMADEIDISTIPSLERQTSHLYQVARCYDFRNNDTAVFVHLQRAERLCPQDFQYKRNVREMVTSLVRRAKPSYAADVREFAARVGMLD
jgi:transcriptional regulator with XRE-family HTH domain